MAKGARDYNTTVDPARVAALRAREDAVFDARIPQSKILLERAKRHMPQGVPMAWMAGLYRFHTVFIAGGDGRTSTMSTAIPISTSMSATSP